MIKIEIKFPCHFSKRAIKTYSHNLFDEDSLFKALVLIDSALYFEKSIGFYFVKYTILRRLGIYKLGINACDNILILDSNNFLATEYKGFLFEDLHLKDSQFAYYYKALNLLDNPKSFNASNILRDKEKIIILGLMEDSIQYKRMFERFKNKYANSKEYFYQGDVEELQTFD